MGCLAFLEQSMMVARSDGYVGFIDTALVVNGNPGEKWIPCDINERTAWGLLL